MGVCCTCQCNNAGQNWSRNSINMDDKKCQFLSQMIIHHMENDMVCENIFEFLG